MKSTLIFAGLALLATPALAQTTGTTTMPPPASGSVANTALSTESTPSTGPRAQQANDPMNSAVAANNSPAATAPDTTAPEAPLASYPICKANQFDKCMEPGNGSGTAKKAKKRRAR